MSDPQPQQPPSVPVSGPKASSSRTPWIVAAVVLVAILLGAGYLLRGRHQPPPPAPAAAPVAATPPAEPQKHEGPGVPARRLPSLGESDVRVRELVGLLSPEPELQKWLTSGDLVRRFTASVGNIAEGESPRTSLSFMAPPGAFQVTQRNGHFFIAPESFARYDAVARVLGSLDTNASALTYKALKPLIDEAFKEISRPGQGFDQTLSRAIQKMLDTPVPQGDIEVLDTPGVNYAYAAPELEQLSAAQKHLLRMGPANVRAVQAKLRELRDAMSLPPATP